MKSRLLVIIILIFTLSCISHMQSDISLQDKTLYTLKMEQSSSCPEYDGQEEAYLICKKNRIDLVYSEREDYLNRLLKTKQSPQHAALTKRSLQSLRSDMASFNQRYRPMLLAAKQRDIQWEKDAALREKEAEIARLIEQQKTQCEEYMNLKTAGENNSKCKNLKKATSIANNVATYGAYIPGVGAAFSQASQYTGYAQAGASIYCIFNPGETRNAGTVWENTFGAIAAIVGADPVLRARNPDLKKYANGMKNFAKASNALNTNDLDLEQKCAKYWDLDKTNGVTPLAN